MKKIIPVALVLLMTISSCGFMPKRLELNGTRVEYKDVSEDEVNALLEYLDDGGFSDGSRKDLKLSKSGDVYNLQMVVKDGYKLNKKNLELMQDFACEISMEVYDGKMLNLDLCDDKFNVQKTVKAKDCDKFAMLNKKLKKFGTTELYYSDEISKDELSDLVSYLRWELDDGVERTFAVDKKDGMGIFSMVIMDKSIYKDPEELKDFEALACEVSDVLGFETVVHLCDEYMKMEKVVKRKNCE